MLSERIVYWLKDYSKKSGTKGFVVGVSGGIDSAVTSTLCAMTNLPTYCLNMPINQRPEEVDLARQHIRWLGKCGKVGIDVQLDDAFNKFSVTVCPPELTVDAKKSALALANSRARLRMMTLYYHAQMYDALVCGTGNKVEDFGVGFFTKYGDGGVDISPIADLYKSEVYELAEELGINEDILHAEPTDGLWDDRRTDEQQLGTTYKRLEWAMKFVENGFMSLDSVLNMEAEDLEALRIYVDLHAKNKHKMTPIPVFKNRP